ncbi:MAG: thioesterase family protein [Syntrophales bacterium]|jgi:acyl-CoA thioester hydrolase|nr:thioesterase family protein [Syntrophales bacterium]NLN59272.1 acyl-CoA thioesterase [Deltaproteobacteria bacterium]
MKSAEAKWAEIRHQVAFYELDPIQVVWHGNYLNYFEKARTALFNENGVDLYEFYAREGILFPIIKTSTKHIAPLRYHDELICRATIVDARVKLVVDFEIRKIHDGGVCTRGRTEQVAVRAPDMEMLFSVPGEIRRALGFWP